MVSIAFGEPGSTTLEKKLASFDQFSSSGLLEAELMSAMTRERMPMPPQLLARVRWVMPGRPLQDEISRVLNAGYVRGADCWHLATALFLAPDPSNISFLTLDVRQGDVARSLGFRK